MTGSVSNYFLGNDQRKWAHDVPSYAEVRYQELYPGTNLRFYTNNKQLEYDFELAPGADERRIQLRYEGQQKLSIVKGALHVSTSVGTVIEQSPVAYQLMNGQRVNVPCQYVLGTNSTLSFAFPQGFDKTKALVIDPVLVYSSYSGSSAQNYGYTATYDDQGNLYAGGTVFGTGYPVTTGAYQVTFAGNQDYGIIKYNPSATTRQASRVYATYIGGSSIDHPHSMVVDPAGNLIIMGSTTSANFPTTTGAFDTSYNSGSDIVISKLNSTGTALLSSTFLGGSGEDGQTPTALRKNYGDAYRGDVTTDAAGNVYIASTTASANFPILNGFQRTRTGANDAVVVKLNPGLAGLVWSTYLGGSADDAAYSVQIDPTGNVFVSGGTASTNFPGVSGGLHAQYLGGIDGFVARIAPLGNDLFQASYIGTSAYDQAHFVQLDNQGAVYLYGQTSGNYPVTAGVYSNPNSRQFIHKLNRNLTATTFSTVVGNGPSSGDTNISPTAFLVDNCGQILLSGWGDTDDIRNMPVTPGAIQSAPIGSGGFGSFYIMQLSANAGGLVYGTYFGNGSCHVDGGTSRFDKRGIIYQSMCVSSGNSLPTTPNSWASSSSSSWNNAAFKIDVLQLDATFTPSDVPAGPRIRRGCAPLRVYFTRSVVTGTSANWDFGNGQTSTNNVSQVSTVYQNPGRYVAKLTVFDPSNCLQSATSTDTVEVFGLPPAAAGPDRTICEGGSVTISVPDAGQGVTYTWFPPVGLNTTNGRTVIASPTASTYYLLTTTTPNGCNGKDTVLVNVAPRLQVSISSNTSNEFTGTPITFTPTTSTTPGTLSYLWNFGDGQTSTERAPAHIYTEPGNYQVRLTTKYGPNGQCDNVQELAVVVRKFELPNIITPNGDGKNDTFKPFVAFQPINIKIFNRWGKQVFEQNNYTEGWGTDNVPGGLYYYKIDSNSGESWKGWLEVAR